MNIMTDKEIINQILEELGFILINYTDGLRSYVQYEYILHKSTKYHMLINLIYEDELMVKISDVYYYSKGDSKIIANLFNNIPPLTYIKNKLNNIKISEFRNKFIKDILDS